MSSVKWRQFCLGLNTDDVKVYNNSVKSNHNITLWWISNFIPHIIMDAITHPCWDQSQSMLVKGATGITSWYHIVCDKDDLLSSAGNSPYVYENFTAEYKNEIEKVHTSFMKRTLNVSKYSSNKCMYGELARFPLSHNAWGLGIKYWLRLYNGTNNTLLNNCYRLNVEENHQWVQNIQYILTSNGFSDIWSNPQIVCGEFQRFWKCVLTINLFRNGKAPYPRHHVL